MVASKGVVWSYWALALVELQLGALEEREPTVLIADPKQDLVFRCGMDNFGGGHVDEDERAGPIS